MNVFAIVKNIYLIFLFAFALLTGCDPTSPSTPEDAAISDNKATISHSYGETIDATGAVETDALLAKLADQDSVKLKVESTILETCPVKGCWMTVALDQHQEMRVTFKDYGFFVPKEGVEGKEVVFEGYATKVVTDVEALRHYAKDAGQSKEEIDAITEPREEVNFVATGVLIKD